MTITKPMVRFLNIFLMTLAETFISSFCREGLLIKKLHNLSGMVRTMCLWSEFKNSLERLSAQMSVYFFPHLLQSLLLQVKGTFLISPQLVQMYVAKPHSGEQQISIFSTSWMVSCESLLLYNSLKSNQLLSRLRMYSKLNSFSFIAAMISLSIY